MIGFRRCAAVGALPLLYLLKEMTGTGIRNRAKGVSWSQTEARMKRMLTFRSKRAHLQCHFKWLTVIGALTCQVLPAQPHTPAAWERRHQSTSRAEYGLAPHLLP